MATATGVVDHVLRPHVATVEDKYLRTPSSGGEAYLPQDAPPGVARVVGGIVRLFEARSMHDHCAPMPMLARDLVWDAPPFLLRCGVEGRCWTLLGAALCCWALRCAAVCCGVLRMRTSPACLHVQAHHAAFAQQSSAWGVN